MSTIFLFFFSKKHLTIKKNAFTIKVHLLMRLLRGLAHVNGLFYLSIIFQFLLESNTFLILKLLNTIFAKLSILFLCFSFL